MKKLALVLVLILSSQLSVIAQNIDMKPSQLKSVLCKQWKVEFAKMGDMKIEELPGATNFDLIFEPEGTYKVLYENEDNASGTWTYDKDNRVVELEAEGNVKFKVKSVDKEKLIINLNLGEDAPLGMSNLELHFKPHKNS